MNNSIPSAAEIKQLLAGLNQAALRLLATSSGVPFTTLMKIRQGYVTNPGIETVRKFVDLIPDPEIAVAGAED